jgi:hypothetical protein
MSGWLDPGPNWWGNQGTAWPCNNGIIYAEWTCGTVTSGGCHGSSDMLKIRIVCDGSTDPIEDGGFSCVDPCPSHPTTCARVIADRQEFIGELIGCDCGSGDDPAQFYFEYETTAFFTACCGNAAPIGPRLRWRITEV